MENKNLFYKAIIVIILVITGTGLIILKKPATTPTIPEEENKEIILSELEKLNIKITGPLTEQVEIQLPSTLSDTNWGLKKLVCQEGDYDLSAHTGKTLLFTSYPISELYDNTEPLEVWVVSSKAKIVCVYKTAKNITPGIFSVKKTL